MLIQKEEKHQSRRKSRKLFADCMCGSDGLHLDPSIEDWNQALSNPMQGLGLVSRHNRTLSALRIPEHAVQGMPLPTVSYWRTTHRFTDKQVRCFHWSPTQAWLTCMHSYLVLWAQTASPILHVTLYMPHRRVAYSNFSYCHTMNLSS
jgi:hypothetical protein